MNNREYITNIMMSSCKYNEGKKYWRDRLSDNIVLSNFPYDISNNKNLDFKNTKSISCNIDDNINKKLSSMANNSDIGLYILLLAALEILIYKYTYDAQITIGIPILKDKNDLEYINEVLPFTFNINQNMTIKEIIVKVKEQIKFDYKNQNFPYFKFIDKETLGKSSEDNILFNTVVALNNIHNFKNDFSDIKFTFYRKNFLNLTIEFNCNKYYEETINQILRHYQVVLNTLATQVNSEIKDIDILSAEERWKLLYDFNNAQMDIRTSKTIHELFEEQVRRTPNNLAVIFENQKYTYEELNGKANSFARALREKGVGAGSLVAIIVDRSLEMIISILAVLKAGGAYLPIDPEYPEQRIEYILKNSKSNVLIHDEKTNNKVNYDGLTFNADDKANYMNNKDNLENTNNLNSLAYVIYTSGTTGSPKGVMVEHKGIVNLSQFFKAEFNINQNNKILQFASISFDACCWEIYMALLQGAKLYIPTKECILNSEELNDYIKRNDINVITLPPFYVSELDINDSPLELVFTAGSMAAPSLLGKFKANMNYVNAYGPTEDTIATTIWKKDSLNSGVIPIGKPIANHKVYILDGNNCLTPIGVTGEICISGCGVARGYLNNRILTEEKFVENPFEAGKKMYKTGDLGRWMADGNIEYLDRKDNQVKIRGHRIELGEVESSILKINKINEAVVVDREKDGNKYLCAYFTSEIQYNSNQLREELRKWLPNYMIPTYFLMLPQIPLTINGKIDRDKLPEPNENNITGVQHLAPESETEKFIANIWGNILGVEINSVYDEFFQIGGDSLKLVAVISKLREEFSINLAIYDLIQHSNIRSLAQFIDNSENNRIIVKDSNVTLLKRGSNSLKNIFFIHGGLGDAEAYMDLSSYLNSDFNCWGISSDKFKGCGLKNISIEETARKYVEKIFLYQPNGPYYIIGWCVGGTIAYEIVRQLESYGMEVKMLSIIDECSPKGLKCTENEDFIFTDTESEKRFIDKLIDSNEISGKLMKMTDVNEMWSLLIGYLKKGSIDTGLILNKMPDIISAAFSNYNFMDLEELFYYMNIGRSYFSGRYAYIPKSNIKTPIHFFKATESFFTDEDWQSLTENEYEKYIIEGNHYTVIKDNNCISISTILNNIILDTCKNTVLK